MLTILPVNHNIYQITNYIIRCAISIGVTKLTLGTLPKNHSLPNPRPLHKNQLSKLVLLAIFADACFEDFCAMLRKKCVYNIAAAVQLEDSAVIHQFPVKIDFYLQYLVNYDILEAKYMNFTQIIFYNYAKVLLFFIMSFNLNFQIVVTTKKRIYLDMYINF